MKIVISIGGSLLTKGSDFSNPDSYTKNFNKYAKIVKDIYDDGYEVVVVCGGGIPARMFQKVGKHFTRDTEILDRLGIVATDLNAYLFLAALNKIEDDIVYGEVLKDPSDVGYTNLSTSGNKIIVCSGWKPGCSTDLDAVLHAKAISADIVINATNVDGVYTTDPDKDPTAKKLKSLSYKEFENIVSKIPQEPGEYRLFDLKAVEILKRERIKLVIVDGSDPNEILRAIQGNHNGTTIS